MIETPEVVALVLVIAFFLLAALITVRRRLLTRSGGVAVCWRRPGPAGVSWTFGQARYENRGLVLFRSFSPLPVPSMILRRDRLVLGDRRSPNGTEPDLLPLGSVIVTCRDGDRPVELALSEAALTGLRSWLESVPPGRRGPRGQLREI